jgi:hypothetical protein
MGHKETSAVQKRTPETFADYQNLNSILVIRTAGVLNSTTALPCRQGEKGASSRSINGGLGKFWS